MSQTDQTLEQVGDSLTGFDEIAIAQQFGRTYGSLAEHDPSMFTRALVFTVNRRNGQSDIDAYQAAMELTMGEIPGFFAEESDEEAGKEQEPEEPPGTSLSSVS